MKSWRCCALAILFAAAALTGGVGVRAFQSGPSSAVAPVDVIVRVIDRDGRAVSGLRADEFELSDGGQRQPLIHVEEISRRPAATAPARFMSDTTSAVATNEGSADGRLFVLVLDRIGTSPADAVAVRVIARRFVERHLAAPDLLSVFFTGDDMPGAPEFAMDRAAALSAIDRFAALGCSRSGRASAADLASAIASRFTDIEARRVGLLWIGASGLDATDRRQRTAIDGLRQAGMVVHAVDPRQIDLRSERLTPADEALIAALSERRPPSCGTTAAALRDFAEQTGGFALVDKQDIDAGLARIVAENSQYYVLRFHPRRAPRAGEFVSVDVRVRNRPDVHVTGRPGFGSVASRSDAPGFANVPAPLAAALAHPLPSGEVPIRAQAIARGGRVHLVVDVPGRTLEFTERDGQHHETLSFAAAILDAPRPASQPAPQVVETAQLPLHLSPAQLDNVTRSGIRWMCSLDLGSGHHSLRVAVHAADANRSGSVMLDVDVPWADEGAWWLGGVAVTSDAARSAISTGLAPAALGLPGPPTTARTFEPGEIVTLSPGVRAPNDVGRATFSLSVRPASAAGPGDAVFTRVVATEGRAAAERPTAWRIDTRALGTGRFVARFGVEDDRGRSSETRLLFEVTPGN